MSELSEKNMSVFKAAKEYYIANGISPSLVDLAVPLNMKVGSVQFHLKKLMDAGLIKFTPKTARSIVFIDDELLFTKDEMNIINSLFQVRKNTIDSVLKEVITKMKNHHISGGKIKALDLLNKRLKKLKKAR